MIFDKNFEFHKLQRQPKSQKQILIERALQPNMYTNSTKF